MPRPPLQQQLLLLAIFLIPALCAATSKSVRFELLHRHHPELSGQIPANPQTQLERVQDLVRSDALRQHWISTRLRRRRSSSSSSLRRRANEASDTHGAFRMRMRSGAYARTGQYFVLFHVGTPAQKFLLVADTGSDLTWMNCRYRSRNCKQERHPRGRRIFHADHSRTFTPILCSSTACATTLPFSLTKCPTPTSPCAYDYGYADGSSAKGFFANESATIFLSSGRRTKLNGLVIGCSSSFIGSSFRVADGVLSLGHGRHSFATTAMDRFGGKFSYCLVDHLSPRNVSNYLTFGPTPQSSNHRPLTYTNLIANQANEPFYNIQILGISIGGVLLKIPPVVWDLNAEGGVIFDSGTSLTILAAPAYRPLFDALKEALKGFKQVEIEPFEFCFDATTGFTEDLVPKLVLHLDRTGTSVRFEPPVKSYVIDVDVGIKCIGLISTPWPGASTIGNILQQEHLWEFDHRNRRLGFQPSTCVLD